MYEIAGETMPRIAVQVSIILPEMLALNEAFR